jgi:hypothetical protein
MKSQSIFGMCGPFLRTFALPTMLAVAAGFFTLQPAKAAANITLWDTRTAPSSAAPGDRAGWKPVPSELLALEANPAKAASDPGYYGREYTFKGDPVVENAGLTALFQSALGRVVIFSKAAVTTPEGGVQPSPGFGTKVIECTPLLGSTQPTRIRHSEILRNAGDEVVLKATFSVEGGVDASAVFSFGKNGTVEVSPVENARTLRLFSPVEYGIVPGFIGDDLIFNPAEYPSADALQLPAENVFVGLLRGENHTLTLTWPKGSQRLALRMGGDPSGKRRVESIDFDTGGQSLYLTASAAPGIWHREELKPTFLEKDAVIGWRRPFPARWKTQLMEAGVKTTFTFRESKGEIWRGVPGSYTYPVWFDGNDSHFFLSKKVPPKGESLIYFLEGQDTPADFPTPVDILKATLGRQASGPILDIAGRKLRTHHRRKEGEVHRACTCGYTEAIQAVFETGEETAKKDFIRQSLDDMVYFVRNHVERIEDYRRFAGEMATLLKSKESSSAPDLKDALENLSEIVRRIPDEYDVQKENMKTSDHASNLVRQTLALTARHDAGNLKAFMELLTAWRAMGGAQDYVVAQCHVITRKLSQETGYRLATHPEAVGLAEQIRTRCRQMLRNPDGYEIWADY